MLLNSNLKFLVIIEMPFKKVNLKLLHVNYIILLPQIHLLMKVWLTIYVPMKNKRSPNK